MSTYFVINSAAQFYSHKPGYLVSWGVIGKANVFTSERSAEYVSEKHRGSRVVKVVGKKVIEVK